VQSIQACFFEKKSYLEQLEKSHALEKYFPAHFLKVTKVKAIRKGLLAHFKKVETLSESECCIEFLEVLLKKWRTFNQETYKCELAVSVTGR
jgi:hypothetical protein